MCKFYNLLTNRVLAIVNSFSIILDIFDAGMWIFISKRMNFASTRNWGTRFVAPNSNFHFSPKIDFELIQAPQNKFMTTQHKVLCYKQVQKKKNIQKDMNCHQFCKLVQIQYKFSYIYIYIWSILKLSGSPNNQFIISQKPHVITPSLERKHRWVWWRRT